MIGIEIHDKRPQGFLAFDLRDLLDAVGADIHRYRWRCTNVECVGDSAGRVYALDDSGDDVSGAELAELADNLLQVIDGDFEARDESGDRVILIRAVDSTLWELFAPQSVVDRVRCNFHDVRPAQYDAG